MTNSRAEEAIARVLGRLTLIGLIFNVLVPIGIIGVLLFARSTEIDSSSGFTFGDSPQTQILFFALLAVSVIDILVAALVRYHLPEKVMKQSALSRPEAFEKAAVTTGIVIFAINASHTAYGIILGFLGASTEITMLFVALTLLTYQLFRPRLGYLEKIWAKGNTTQSPIS